MGGYGSGRIGSKPKAEHFRALDANKLYRAKFLTVGRAGYWRWFDQDGEASCVGCFMDKAGLRLSYRARQWDEDWQQICYLVPVEWVACTLGGQRPYFHCPMSRRSVYCGKRVAKLYGGTYFACRHCHNLTYASRSESPHDRLLRRANNKRLRLGGEPGVDEIIARRPKGMWHQTYKREIEEILRAEAQADALFSGWLLSKFGTANLADIL